LFLAVVFIKGAPGISGERGDQGKPGRAVSNKRNQMRLSLLFQVSSLLFLQLAKHTYFAYCIVRP